jgi:hypothetical protein
MTTKKSPPYDAWKNPQTGRWYVMNALDRLVMTCDCRQQAEDIAREMNKEVKPSLLQVLITNTCVAALQAGLSRDDVLAALIRATELIDTSEED